MKFPLKLLSFLLLASPIFGQVHISGNLKDVTTGNVTTNVQVDFELQNYGSNIPHIATVGTVVQIKKTFKPDASGAISGTLYQNSVIIPAGTFYKVCIIIQGNTLRCNNYLINSDFDLDNAVPLNVTPVVGPGQLIVQCSGFNFLSPSATWILSHNFGDANVWGNSFDLNGNQIIPDRTTKTDSNTLTLTWIIPQAGAGLACHAGNVNIATNQPNAVVVNPSASQTIVQQRFSTQGGGTHSGDEIFTGTLSSATIGPNLSQQHQIPVAAPDTLALLIATQTLSNKTLTSPVINTPTLNGSGGQLLLPAGPDTLVGLSTVATLANKTLVDVTLSGNVSGSATWIGAQTFNGSNTFVSNQFFQQGLVITETSFLPSTTGSDICGGNSTSHTLQCTYNGDTARSVTRTIASGTASMPTASITGPNCSSVVTVSAPGVLTTDSIRWSFNSAPVANPGELIIAQWPTADNVNFKYCVQSGTIIPTTATLNWSVTR